MFLELKESIRLTELLRPHGRLHLLLQVKKGREEFPIHAIELGTEDPNAPVLGIVGGIHGLEKIGTRVCNSFMDHIHSRLEWDESLKFMLSRMRIFFIPLVNPIGMKQFSRCNGNGVDLMRNAPIESEEASFGVGGQRLSPHLPWYRGNQSMTLDGMEPELKSVFDFIQKQTSQSKASVILDLHSGFGIVDQIWFPYAKEKAPAPILPELYAFKSLFESTNPNHVYRFEPQAKHYCTHGDLWDYLLTEREKNSSTRHHFLPLTLEMGSWNWVKKNPIQLFSFLGAFNPIKPHRMKRTLRRHLPLFDFLLQALSSPTRWINLEDEERARFLEKALKEWY